VLLRLSETRGFAADIAQLGPVGLAEQQEFAVAPEEPHRVRLRGATRADGRQPDDLFFGQPAGGLRSEFCCGVDQLLGSGGHVGLLDRGVVVERQQCGLARDSPPGADPPVTEG
jgi:hypothetical protein